MQEDTIAMPGYRICEYVLVLDPGQDKTQRLMKLDNDHKPYFDMEPHITIGRKLKPWQYEKAWLEFSNKHFTGRFIADAMLLLKRQQGERAWQIVQWFEF